MNVFSSEKNATNRKIFNSLTLTENELKNLIKVYNDEIKIRYNKIRENAKIIKNDYNNKKKKKEEERKEKEREEKEREEEKRREERREEEKERRRES